MSDRTYDRIFTRAQERVSWAHRTPLTAHVLRHTAITAVERVAGFAVAQAFAGHTPGSVTGTYTKADTSTYRPGAVTVTIDRPDQPRIARALHQLTDELNATPAHIPGDIRPITYQISP